MERRVFDDLVGKIHAIINPHKDRWGHEMTPSYEDIEKGLVLSVLLLAEVIRDGQTNEK